MGRESLLPAETPTHKVDVIYGDDEGGWTVICDCMWEAWNHRTKASAEAIHAAHVLDPEPHVPGGWTS